MVAEGKTEKIGGYAIHALASQFPLLEGYEFDELVESVLTNGLNKKIILCPFGSIVDGRNRLRACLKAKVTPQFRQLTEHDDILEIVLDENVRRRHLDASQRAMFAAALTGDTIGRPKKASTTVAIDVAAEKLNVSRSAVVSAKVVRDEGTPELQAAVVAGEIKVTPAARMAKLPAEQQVEAVAQVRSGDSIPRTRASDATFNYEKWAKKAEVQYSKMLAEVPADLNDRARGTFRDITGGSLRREAKIDTADDEDVDMFDAEDIIARTDRMLKELPVAERKGIKQAIGVHYIGDKPEQYMPGFSDEDTDVSILTVLVAELRYRLPLLESYPAEQKALKKLISDLKKLTKSDEVAE
jgi:ParB-like chromosome segregation protein Spo0J